LHVDRSESLRAVYESTLPIAGRDGTLEIRMRGTVAEGRTADGPMVAFAIIANNFENSSAVLNAATDEIIVRIASYRSR
jgi:D-alanyl-D-alanine carboxypeptidase